MITTRRDLTNNQELKDARESLEILEDTERFLVEEVGAGGNLTLANAGKWADQLAECRQMIACQKQAIARLEATP